MSGPAVGDGDEAAQVRARYARRQATVGPWRYNPVNPAVWQSMQERERAVLALWRSLGWTDLAARDLFEVGCGGGTNLLEMLRHGFLAERLAAVELLEERWHEARERLPAALRVTLGDAGQLDLPPASFDVVLQSTVFSSLLDDTFQEHLARRMWSWVRPGGGVLWYDFTVDNPRNRDVRGVPLSRVRALFPEGRVTARRVTLAPPVARVVTRLHPSLYTLFNTLPLLRTHTLCWIAKA